MTMVPGSSCHRLAQLLTFPASVSSVSWRGKWQQFPKFNIQSGLAQSPEYKNSSINHQKTEEEKAACYKSALMEHGTEAVGGEGEWLSWRQQTPAGSRTARLVGSTARKHDRKSHTNCEVPTDTTPESDMPRMAGAHFPGA